MNELVKWLSGLPRTTNVKAVTLTVKGETFEGAVYDQTNSYTKGMAAVDRGDKSDGETYTDTRYYFHGKIPKCRQKRQSLCFTHEGRVLYLSSHYQKFDKNEYPHYQKFDKNEYHPFGPCFQLGIWDEAKLGKIDLPRRSPYHRVPVEIV